MNSSPVRTVIVGSGSEADAKRKVDANTIPDYDAKGSADDTSATSKMTSPPRRPILLAATEGVDVSPRMVQLTVKIGRTLLERYGPYVPQPSLASRLKLLSSEQRATFEELKSSKQEWSDTMLLEVATFTDFDQTVALQLLNRMNLVRWENLKVERLTKEFADQSIVPLPQLHTKTTTDVVYLHPARFTQACDPLRLLIYTFMCLKERHKGDVCKLGLLFNMQDYRFSFEQMASFSLEHWISLMQLMQGQRGPIQVNDVLWVNCSVDFLKVWKNTLKPQCTQDFKWRISLVAEDARFLTKYLNEGHETSLPTELCQGQAAVADLSHDFQQYRQALEVVLSQEEQHVAVREGAVGASPNVEVDAKQECQADSETKSKTEQEVPIADRLTHAVHSNHESETVTDGKDMEKKKIKTKKKKKKTKKAAGDISAASEVEQSVEAKEEQILRAYTIDGLFDESAVQDNTTRSENVEMSTEGHLVHHSGEQNGTAARDHTSDPNVVATMKESDAHYVPAEGNVEGPGTEPIYDDRTVDSVSGEDDVTTLDVKLRSGEEDASKRTEDVSEKKETACVDNLQKISVDVSEDRETIVQRDEDEMNTRREAQNPSSATEESHKKAAQVIAASFKATAVVLQHGRSVAEAREITEETQKASTCLSQLTGKKSLWKGLRTRVSETVSSLEIQLSATIGESLVRRYGPFPPKPTLATKLGALTPEQQAAYDGIKATWIEEWEVVHPGDQQPWKEDTILRVSSFSEFEIEEALELLRRMRPNHWQNLVHAVDSSTLAEDMQSLAVFPLPGLATRAAKDVVYVYPKRFTASCNPLRLLTYTMNCMYDRHGEHSRCKLALLMNLGGYRFSSKQLEAFPLEDWVTWMELIQGQNGPLRVVQVLMVNATPEFMKVWKAKLRQHCEDGFSWRFNLVEDADHLHKYLKEGLEDLPQDLPSGKARVKDLARDFMKYRGVLESIIGEQERAAEEKELKLEFLQALEEDSDNDPGLVPGPGPAAESVPTVNRRVMMSRHSSMSDVGAAKRSSKAPLRKYASKRNLTADSSSTPSEDRRGKLHRSASVQAMQSRSSNRKISHGDYSGPADGSRRMLPRTNSVGAMSTNDKVVGTEELSIDRRRMLNRTTSVQAMGSVSRRRHLMKATSRRELQNEKNPGNFPHSSNETRKEVGSNNDPREERLDEAQEHERKNEKEEHSENDDPAMQPQDRINGDQEGQPERGTKSTGPMSTAPSRVDSDETSANDDPIQETNASETVNATPDGELRDDNDSDISSKKDEADVGNRTAKEGDTYDVLDENGSPDEDAEQDQAQEPLEYGEVGENTDEKTELRGSVVTGPTDDDDAHLEVKRDNEFRIISASSKAAAVLLQCERSVTENDDSEKKETKSSYLSGLVGKKNTWKALRTKVSQAASPFEVQLAIKIGDLLARTYGPFPPQSTVKTKIEKLNSTESSALARIQETWEEEWALLHRKDPQPWDDKVILRVSVFSDFQIEESIELLRRMSLSHWHNSVHTVSASTLADDFGSLAIVPLPKITTKAAKDVVYVCPKRFTAASQPMRLLTYAMNCMYDRHGDALTRCKLALMMNMDGYRFSSKQQQAFSLQDWISWMELIQGQNGPMRVSQIMFVNAPKEFKLVFRAKLREHCQDGFSWRFNVIDDETTLDRYLTPGFEEHLPSDFPQGQAHIKDLVRDFLTYRLALEGILAEQDGLYQQKKQERHEALDEVSDGEDSSPDIKPVSRVNRRAMMSRHSSMSSMNTPKRSLHAPRRKFNVGDRPFPSSAVDRRQMLHRSNSVQTMGSPNGFDRRGRMKRVTSRRRLEASSAHVVNGETPNCRVHPERSANDSPQIDKHEEEEGMLQHLQRNQSRDLLSCSSHHSTSLGSSRHREGAARPRATRETSRRHLLHRSNSAQNLS